MMPKATSTVTLDRTSRVTLGLVASVLAVVAGGVWHFSTMRTDISQMNRSLVDVKKALDRNTAQLQRDSRTLAILETLMKSYGERLRKLEEKK